MGEGFENKGVAKGIWGIGENDRIFLYFNCSGDYTNLHVKIQRTVNQSISFTICKLMNLKRKIKLK